MQEQIYEEPPPRFDPYKDTQPHRPPPATQPLLESDTYHFVEIFKEPETPQVPEKAYDVFKIVFNMVTTYTYLVFSLVLGIPVLILSGILLGLEAFCITWIMNPCIKCQTSCLAQWRRIIVSYLKCCLEPYLETLSVCCSKIVVRHQKIPPGQVMHV